jgi:hypothetical protein
LTKKPFPKTEVESETTDFGKPSPSSAYPPERWNSELRYAYSGFSTLSKRILWLGIGVRESFHKQKEASVPQGAEAHETQIFNQTPIHSLRGETDSEKHNPPYETAHNPDKTENIHENQKKS